MRLIDADKFLQDMADLYRQAGWGEREVHFSLADLRSNIDMEDVAMITCKDCAHYHNWAPTAKQCFYWFRLNGQVVGHTTGEYLAERQLLARLMAFAEIYRDYKKE